MFLVHNGVVRQGIDDGSMVKGMEFAYDDALQFLVEKIKSECVTEIEQK